MQKSAAKVILILLLSSTAAFGQDFNLYGFTAIDYALIGAGARARAMGGAFTGVADDASALTWNPAGLIQVDKTQASISGSFLPLEQKTSITYLGNPQRDLSAKYRDDKGKLSYASFVAPIRIKGHPFMASVAYQGVQDRLADDYNWTDILYFYVTPSAVGVGGGTETSRTTLVGGLDEISLGFGTGLYGALSVGGAVNVYTGSSESAYRADFLDTIPSYFGGQVVDTVRIRAAGNVRDKADSKGFNFSGALLYRKDKVRLGINVKTPFQVVTDHDLVRADTTYRKSIRVPGEGVPSAIRPTLYRGKAKLQIPVSVAAGASYQVTPKLLIAADAELKPFSNSKYYVRAEQVPENVLDSINLFTLPGSMYYSDTGQTSYYTSAGELIEIFHEFDLKLESSLQLRFGAEYMEKTSIGIIPIRAGVRFTQEPYRDVSKLVRDYYAQPQTDTTVSPPVPFQLGSKVKNTVFTFGSGIHWRQIWLDFAVELNSEKQQESGRNAYGPYANEKKRNSPAYIFNFTGFF